MKQPVPNRTAVATVKKSERRVLRDNSKPFFGGYRITALPEIKSLLDAPAGCG